MAMFSILVHLKCGRDQPKHRANIEGTKVIMTFVTPHLGMLAIETWHLRHA
jgi:hypothetical protein